MAGGHLGGLFGHAVPPLPGLGAHGSVCPWSVALEKGGKGGNGGKGAKGSKGDNTFRGQANPKRKGNAIVRVPGGILGAWQCVRRRSECTANVCYAGREFDEGGEVENVEVGG